MAANLFSTTPVKNYNFLIANPKRKIKIFNDLVIFYLPMSKKY